MNTRKFFFLLASVLSFACSFGQVFLPAEHTVSNKSYGVAQAAPTDARSYFYDANNFVYRPYQNTAEVLSYLSLSKYRTGQFDIVVNSGGTINPDGTLTGGTNTIYYFRNGTADGDLVQKISVVPTLSATNAITFDGIGQFKLGGTGTENTTIGWGAFTFSQTFNSLAGVNGFNISSTSTLAAGSAQRLVNIALSGVNATSGQITHSLYVSNTHTGTSSTNYGIFGVASGAAAFNYGVYGQSTGSNSYGVYGENQSGGTAIFGSGNSASAAISGNNTSNGAGLQGSSVGGLGLQATTSATGTTTRTTVARFTRQLSTGTAANNIGGQISLDAPTTTASSGANLGFMGWSWDDATDATRSGKIDFSIVNNAAAAAVKFSIKGTGEATFSGYGAGANTGTLTKYAGFTSAGKLIEVDAPTSTWNGSFYGVATITLATWSVSESSTFQIYTGAVPSTWTLPDRATSTKTIWIKNNGSANVTVQRLGSDQIWTNSAVNSVVLTPGQSRAFYPIGGYWTSYFDASGAGGSLDAVPTDASTNGVESNGVFDALALKQNLLTSGTTIKTINSTTLLGSGNIDVAALSHTHATSDITGLDAAIAALQPDATLTNGDASPIQNNAVYDEFQVAYTSIGTKLAIASNLSDVANPATALSNLGGTPLNRSITIYGADVPTYDFASDRTYYPKPFAIQAYEALGSTIKGQTVGVELNQMTTTSFQAADGTVYWVALWLPSAETLTGIKFWQGTTGTFTGDNFNGFALYSYSGGTLTQVATSANDENIWKGTTNSLQSVPFTGTYSAAAGLYYVAFVFNASATTAAPFFGIGASAAVGGMNSGDFTNSAKLMATQTSQTTLPATRAMSALTVTTLRPWVGVY